MGYKVRIDKQSCQSSGRCVALEPDHFVLDGDHLAEVQDGGSALSDERLIEIARACPACAILLYDEAGEEVDVYAA